MDPKEGSNFRKPPFEFEDRLAEPAALSDHKADSVAFRLRSHLPCLLRVQRHRLFDEDVLPSPGRGKSRRVMEMVGQGDNHGFYVLPVENVFVPGGKCLGVKTLGRISRLF